MLGLIVDATLGPRVNGDADSRIDVGDSRWMSCLTTDCVSAASFGRVVVEAATYTARDSSPSTTAMYGLSSLRPAENCICLPRHYRILR